jgi:hypothetical protein
MFPLSIFPLPGELVPLHIFEPRYKQLLQDAETKDITFGIYFNHGRNKDQMGSLVKLESIIKRYPGGEVQFMNTDIFEPVSHKLLESYHTLGKPLKLELKAKTISIFDLANELSLDFDERLKFVACDSDKKESFILSRLRYQHQLQVQAEKAKDVFHLN